MMVASLAENARRSFWDEWAGIACPTLAVLGRRGILSPQEIDGMLQRRPEAVAVSIPQAGHDLHLEHPDVLGRVVEEFLGTVAPHA
ncbi:alpha/beta fold hydrolase [Streptomyces sp. NPDC002519]